MEAKGMYLLLVFIMLSMDTCYSGAIPRSFDPRLTDEVIMTPKKRPFCNAFTGCGRKRSQNVPGMPLQEMLRQRQMADEELNSILDSDTLEDLSRQLLNEAKLWETIQEAAMESRRKQKDLPMVYNAQ